MKTSKSSLLYIVLAIGFGIPSTNAYPNGTQLRTEAKNTKMPINSSSRSFLANARPARAENKVAAENQPKIASISVFSSAYGELVD